MLIKPKPDKEVFLVFLSIAFVSMEILKLVMLEDLSYASRQQLSYESKVFT